jgi:hypothetical protein
MPDLSYSSTASDYTVAFKKSNFTNNTGSAITLNFKNAKAVVIKNNEQAVITLTVVSINTGATNFWLTKQNYSASAGKDAVLTKAGKGLTLTIAA